VIGEVFGGEIISASRIVHGMVEAVSHDGKGLFRNTTAQINCTRYHSLAINREKLPDDLEITATTADGEIMGVRHKTFIVEGVQFHPESIASEEGRKLLLNFINYRREAFPVKEKLEKIMDGRDLTREEAALFMEELTDGSLSELYIAGYLTALNAKGICAEEIAGCASVLQKKRTPIRTTEPVLGKRIKIVNNKIHTKPPLPTQLPKPLISLRFLQIPVQESNHRQSRHLPEDKYYRLFSIRF